MEMSIDVWSCFCEARTSVVVLVQKYGKKPGWGFWGWKACLIDGQSIVKYVVEINLFLLPHVQVLRLTEWPTAKLALIVVISRKAFPAWETIETVAVSATFQLSLLASDGGVLGRSEEWQAILGADILVRERLVFSPAPYCMRQKSTNMEETIIIHIISLSCKVTLRWLWRLHFLRFRLNRMWLPATESPLEAREVVDVWEKDERCEERIHRWFIGILKPCFFLRFDSTHCILHCILSRLSTKNFGLISFQKQDQDPSFTFMYIHLQHPHIPRWSCFT